MNEKRYQLKSKEDGLDNHVIMTIKSDGTIYFSEKDSNSEHFIYLYPKQAKKMIKTIIDRFAKEVYSE